MLPEGLRATNSSHLQGLLKDILLENSPGSRVVYESSCLEQWGHIDWDDIGCGAACLLQCVHLLWTLTLPNSPQAVNVLLYLPGAPWQRNSAGHALHWYCEPEALHQSTPGTASAGVPRATRPTWACMAPLVAVLPSFHSAAVALLACRYGTSKLYLLMIVKELQRRYGVRCTSGVSCARFS